MEKEHTNQGTRQGIRFHSIVFLLFAQTDIYAGEGRANDQEKKKKTRQTDHMPQYHNAYCVNTIAAISTSKTFNLQKMIDPFSVWQS